MTGPGIFSYSTTPASNVAANTGINMDEGMPPAILNNSIRQIQTDIRNQHNDLIWFKYGKGDLDYSPVYASATTFTVAGADVTAVYHVGRRVKAVGSGTGTIYGSISVTAFSTNTTVTVVWDSGSLSNETLTIYLSQIPVTGSPVHPLSVAGNVAPTSFTPTLTFGGGSTGMSLTATGRYSKTNGVVNFSIKLVVTTVGSSTGNASIGGLPIASSTLDTTHAMFAAGMDAALTDASVCALAAGAQAMTPYHLTAGTEGILTNSNFANGATLVITGSYFAQ